MFEVCRQVPREAVVASDYAVVRVRDDEGEFRCHRRILQSSDRQVESAECRGSKHCLSPWPAATAGWLLKDFANGQLRDPVLIAVGLIVFGIVLGIADWKGRGTRDEYSLTLRDVLVIGFAQVLALFPGTSRAGITMTAALFVGLSRDAAARFSFLLSVPIIAAATLLSTRDLVGRGAETEWGILLFGFVVSAASTYAMVHLFLSFIRRIGMQPFVIYRVALGVVLLAMFW
ncbi:MAG: undecaprenyl-diphosphate phosphatase [Xanthomonadaceae bacterium]|nr:undecaprenyl-diphosphate phosphatase [Xanthomonadaceae bacterium]